MRPRVESRMPVNCRSRVVLPAPFGPSTPTMPRSTSKLTAARALTVVDGQVEAEELGRRGAP